MGGVWGGGIVVCWGASARTRYHDLHVMSFVMWFLLVNGDVLVLRSRMAKIKKFTLKGAVPTMETGSLLSPFRVAATGPVAADRTGLYKE